MFTPQRVWSGWSLTPSKTGARGTGTGSGSGPELGPYSGEGGGSKGKGVAFGENGGSVDREALAERVSSLEKEVSLIRFVDSVS